MSDPILIDDPAVAGPDWLHQPDTADEFAYNPNQPRVPAGSSEGGRWTDGGGSGGSTYSGDAAAATEAAADAARQGLDPSEFDGPLVHRGIAIGMTPEQWNRFQPAMAPEDFNQHLRNGPEIIMKALGFEGHQGDDRTSGLGRSWTTNLRVAESITATDENVKVVITATPRRQDIIAQEIDGEIVGDDSLDMVSGEAEVRLAGNSPVDIVDVKVLYGGEWRTVWGEDQGVGAGEAEMERYYQMSTMRRSRQFHLQGQHDQSTHGRRYGRTKAMSEPDGGMTVDAVQLDPINTGYAVAVGGSDRLLLASDAFDADGEPSKALKRNISERIDAARNAGAPDGTRLAVGGWHNPADGKVEVNVTIVFPSDRRDDAVQFAVDNDQIAMADLEAIARGDWDNAIIDTGGTGGNRDVD